MYFQVDLVRHITMDTPLLSRILSLLSDEKYQEALIVVNDAENEDQLKQISWDIVPQLCDLLTAENETDKPELIETCEDILLHLTDVSNVKELLLVLLEQSDMFKDDVKFMTLLPPIQQCLLKLPSKKSHSLAITLQTLYAHFETLQPPENDSYDANEKALLDCDENVRRNNQSVSAMLKFLQPFVQEMAWRDMSEKERSAHKNQIQELVLFLIKLLSSVMLYSDMSGEAPKSKSRVLGEELMDMLETLEGDLVKVLLVNLQNNKRINLQRQRKEKKQKERGDECDVMDDFIVEEIVPLAGLSNLSYLIFAEKLASCCIPSVYAHEFLFEINFVFIQTLLSNTNNYATEKGAHLLLGLVASIRPLSLSASYLDQEDIKASFDSLVQVVCSGRVKNTSRLCIQALGLLFRCFAAHGRHRFLLFLFNKYSHPGLIGYAISLLKDQLDYNLSLSQPDEHFQGRLLESLLKHVYALPRAEKTDLLEKSEWIMGALNLLRYLVLRDVNNVTGIWKLMDKIDKLYLDMLQKAIEISRAHYKLDADEIKKGKGERKHVEMEFTVGADAMPGLNRAQQLNVLETAIHTFDMMESVRGRVVELIGQQRKKRQGGSEVEKKEVEMG